MTPHPQHIMLVTGRWVSIRELEQWETYEGLLAGHPTHEDNQRQLERIVGRYRERDDALPYVIEPPEEPIEDVEGWPHLGTPARMPGVICLARLDSRPLREIPVAMALSCASSGCSSSSPSPSTLRPSSRSGPSSGRDRRGHTGCSRTRHHRIGP